MPDSSQLDDFVPYQLSITSNMVSQLIAGEYHTRFGLKVPEWRVMAVLGDVSQATQRDIAWRSYMDKVAVNRACKGLEERALIARVPNQADGRSHLLALTEAGWALHGEIMPLALRMEKRLLERFCDEERATLTALLERLRRAVEAEQGNGKGKG